MKKVICFIAFVLVYFCSVAQTFPQNPTNGQVQINNTNLGGGTFNRGVRGGVFVDTSAANDVLYMKGTKFMLISTTSDNNYWYRSADTMRWELIATTTSNCAGTQLISGSITWSGSGLVYDATDLDYYILCSRYFANSTTLTLAVADPTNPRIDKFYADNTGNIGVITGTPSANPQEPAINPLSQLDMGFVYIPAGSTVPVGTTQTVIYNENVEWSGTSDVPSINFTYPTNPYIGTVSTYLPNAPNSSYVEWQSGGIDYLFSDAQYLKFWVRLNANFVSDPLSFLDVTFEYTDVTVSQTLSVGDGDYNMDYSLINQWQLVSIPLTGITTFGTEFNSVHFVINSAPTSFQLDYVYLLETATVPPVISSGWSLNLNLNTNPATNGLGTRDSVALAFKTNSQTRAIMPANGLQLVDDTTYRVMVWNETTKEWAVTYQPTILADSPVIIYQNGYQDRIKLDTTRRGGALATQYYADSVANAGGGGGGTPTLAQVVTAGNNTTDSVTTGKIIVKTHTRGFLHSIQEWQREDGKVRMSLGDISSLDTSIALKIIGTRGIAEGVELAMVQDESGPNLRNYGGYFYITPTTSNLEWWSRTNDVDNKRLLINNVSGDVDIYNNLNISKELRVSDLTKIQKDQNATTYLSVRNDNSGSAAAAQFTMQTNGGTASLAKYSTTVSPYKILSANDVHLYTNVGDMNFLNDNASGKIQFAAKGSSSAQLIVGGDSTVDVIGGLKINNGRAQSGYVWTASGTNGGGDWKALSVAGSALTGSSLASGITSSSLTSFGSSIALGTPASGNFGVGTFTWPTFNQNTTGSAASLTTARKINGVSFNGTADIAVDKRILAYQALGSTIVAENVDGQLAQVINSLAMTSQRAYFQAVYIDKDQTITGFKWKQATAGSYTANNYNGGALYSYSGGTLTLVASSTNDGNIWTATSGTIGSKAFSSPYSATAGLYFVAIIWSASATTTAPSLGTLTASSSINTVTDFTNSAKTSGLISSLTALPSPTQAISGITASANEFWIGLY